MVGLIIIGYFIVVGAYTAYELHNAPYMDDDGNLVKKTKHEKSSRF
jgi:hypothetical protein